MKRLVFFLFLAFASCSGPAECLEQYFDAVSSQYMGSVVVKKHGKILFSTAQGYADIENAVPAGKETAYLIGSISKTYTSVMVLKAVEKGLLSLTDSISSFFPQVPNADEITVDDLLYHRSGLHDLFEESTQEYLSWCYLPQTREELVGHIAEAGVDAAPGSAYAYCNAGFVLLSFILEDIYDKPYAELLEEQIVAPLQLRNTRYGGRLDPSKGESRSYKHEGTWVLQKETDLSLPVGAGAIMSTPYDVAVFADALFDGFFGSFVLDCMKEVQGQFGRGLFPFDVQGIAGSYGHTGGIDGFVSLFLHLEEDDITVVMCSNGNNLNQDVILHDVLAILRGEEVRMPDYTYMNLPEETLQSYSGTYICPELNMTVILSERNGYMVGQVPGQDAFYLDARGGGVLECARAGISIDFGSDADGFVLCQAGGEYIFDKNR